jgi:hypothetical protein
MPTLATAARPLPWLLALLVAGCSGTRFGEALSGSFSEGSPPPPAASAPTAASAASPQPAAAPPADPQPAGPKPAASKPTASKPIASKPAAPPLAAPRPPANPAPYRLTILLPQADPAAPAEGVTRALRAAGVPFEVETIQRTGTAAAPASSPAQAPSVPPVVRPAPPPP